MSIYKITVEEVIEPEEGKYASNKTLYEQTVNGDESIVNGVVQTVLEYNSHLTKRSNYTLENGEV